MAPRSVFKTKKDFPLGSLVENEKTGTVGIVHSHDCARGFVVVKYPRGEHAERFRTERWSFENTKRHEVV